MKHHTREFTGILLAFVAVLCGFTAPALAGTVTLDNSKGHTPSR